MAYKYLLHILKVEKTFHLSILFLSSQAVDNIITHHKSDFFFIRIFMFVSNDIEKNLNNTIFVKIFQEVSLQSYTKRGLLPHSTNCLLTTPSLHCLFVSSQTRTHKMCFYGKIFCFYDSDENDESSSPRLSLLLTFSQPSGANFFSLARSSSSFEISLNVCFYLFDR